MSALDNRKKGLGRGLDALFGDQAALSAAEQEVIVREIASSDPTRASAPRKIPVGNLKPGPFQPRRFFDPEPIEALAISIANHGVIQPLLVRPHPEEPGIYEIIAGERRWRAAQKAQLHDVPVVIQNLTDTVALEVAIIENIQREDLTPIEEAEAYRRLIDEFGHTQEELGKVVGKSRSHITNMLRLLSLPSSIAQMLQNGKITMGHARALLSAKDPAELARRIVLEGLSVRQVEELVQEEKTGTKKPKKLAGPAAEELYQILGKENKTSKDPDTLALENEMTILLGLKVNIQSRGQEGIFSIQYKTLDQLDDLLRRLTQAVRVGQ